MSKFIPGEVIDLTPEQITAIDWFIANPPKLYKTFFKIYREAKVNLIIFLLLIVEVILAIISVSSPETFSNENMFNVMKYIFFVIFGIGMILLGFYLYKHFYTKRYARKKLGWNMKMWNKCTQGLSWNI